MPVSIECADEHIRAHCARLRNSGTIRDWPRYVVHTVHVDTAVKILKSGLLIPRQQLGNLIHDVANPRAIAMNPEALQYARLYFRPKTAFHFRTEGIKFTTDQYRYESHMSIPVMLAFDARSVLTLDGVGFSNGKLARMFATPGFDEAYFRTIPFEQVYHDGPTRDEGIQDARMSEVVYPGALSLDPHLRYVVCRTVYDRATLLYLLGQEAGDFRTRIITEQTSQSTFIHKALYIKSLVFEEDRLSIAFKMSTWNLIGDEFEVLVRQYVDDELVVCKKTSWPVRNIQRRSTGHVPDPRSIWKIDVEGVTAFHGPLPAGRSRVF